MEQKRLVEICRGTIDPNKREAAEKELETVTKIIGFTPSLLTLVMNSQLDMPTRQAGAVYLKNMVTSYWSDPAEPPAPGLPLEFSIHEQDRAMLRDSIVDAVVQSPPLIRSQMAVCLINVIQSDFPGKWVGIVDKIVVYLQTPNTNDSWLGALLALYQLVKTYEYRMKAEKAPLLEAMNVILPVMQDLALKTLPDGENDTAVSIQKQCLKIFYALIQYSFPLELITRETFGQWMEICRVIIQRPVPLSTLEVSVDERMNLIHWKCKKWALHIVKRSCERYGSPTTVTKEYRELAEFYVKSFAQGIINTLLQYVLEPYRQNQYVSPRVLQQSLIYISLSVGQAHCWKVIKPVMNMIIQEILFKLLCFSDEDEEMWSNDPTEYVRVKFDQFVEHVSPVSAAQELLETVCKKRKNVLQKTMEWVTSLLNSGTLSPRQQDGAFNIVGAVAFTLLRRPPYKTHLENMLCSYVSPLFQSKEGYLRARGCWLLQKFSETKFTRKENLIGCVDLLRNAIMNPQEEVPVKVQAAVALQEILFDQEFVRSFLESHIRELTLCLLDLIRCTEIDEVTSCVQKIVCSYSDALMPVAVDITTHLAQSFNSILVESQKDEDDGDSRAVAAMGILSTMETILAVWEDNKEIGPRLEPIVLNTASAILTQGVSEFYEEAFSLIYSLCGETVSPSMWQIFSIIYEAFERDAHEFFTDMMPILHALVVIDTPAFLSNENHIVALYNMAKFIFEKSDSDSMCHAAKLLEVLILQCGNRIENYIPTFIELSLHRLFQKNDDAELRQMLIQVLIAAMYVNRPLTLSTLERLQTPPLKETNHQPISVIDYFIRQWFAEIDGFHGVHDRKLCALGICCLMDPGWSGKPAVMDSVYPKVMPSLLTLYTGLKKAYIYRASVNSEDSDEEDDAESDNDEHQLSSDEDEIDDDGQAYLENLQSRMQEAGFPTTTGQTTDGDGDNDSLDDEDETALECTYVIPMDSEENDAYVDEFAILKGLLEALEQSAPPMYNQMIHSLSDEQKVQLGEIFLYADQRKAAAHSAKIKTQGGYQFNADQPQPTSFNFGGSNATFGAPK